MAFLKNLNIEPLHSAASRRKKLIESMGQLEVSKIHCQKCTGTCCTYVANSMQITPLEALEVLDGLALGQWGLKALKQKLETTVRDYRLDQEINIGKKTSNQFRRTYTCPFFTPGPHGCGLSRSAKPYGCLAFNPRGVDDNGSFCASDVSLLIERDTNFKSFEDHANELIAKSYKVDWTKRDLPRGLLFFLNQMISDA